ncbi:hypothetical protein [Legionella parisiensis]|uniref:Uncharacterized protein n=1 Tax=Legionella parisiensis TaxID=45071 RepID=A0A1E5JN62_9GAMM|nr:hypothetical protein [Legionella parisiensis]KTD42840.1 hypothetical protein Lpar_0817 [Legionella parisiensis]OEH45964.1 hypothetical protein lpari_03015 [Legionella parisiensis]STX78086.1 Uncharacterised protein [Legionella parisiensis]
MPYLLKGNAEQIFQAFGQGWVVAEQKDDTNIIGDFPSVNFLGTIQQAIRHFSIWRKHALGKYYLRGNMTAGNLSYLFGGEPLKREGESSAVYHANLGCQDFAYINDAGENCGIMVMYRKDDPKQWVIGLIKNGHAEPQAREMVCVSSFDLTPFIQSSDFGVSVSSVSSIEPLLQQIGSAIPSFLLQNAVLGNNEINLSVQRIALLMRKLQIEQETTPLPDPISFAELNLSALFAENPVLDLLFQYKIQDEISLSVSLLKELLSESSPLRQEIQGIQFTDDERINKSLLKSIIVFYKNGILDEQNRKLLTNLELMRKFSGYMKDETQIKLLPFLIQQSYPYDLIQLILSNEAYYRAIDSLVELEPALTEDVPKFFKESKKRQELKFIFSLPDEDCRRLCLIFWVKGSLSEDGYQQIVAATKEYPLLASSLVALDQTKTISIENLEKLALNPHQHLQKSIAHHFAKEFQGLHDVTSKLRKLTLDELKAASTALRLLKKSGITAPLETYHLVLEKDNKGQALRLLLPPLANEMGKMRTLLMEILYSGVVHGVQTQGNKVLAIKDPVELALAKRLRERFICVRQMQDLKLRKELIELAAQEDSEEAKRFRQVILRVEAQCKKIHERLSGAKSSGDMHIQWKGAEEVYRKTLYNLSYDALMNPYAEVHPTLKNAENEILKIVDPEIESDLYRFLYNALVVIANIISCTLFLGVPNGYKHYKTGNFWFFNQTRSGEEIRELDKDVLHLIDLEHSDENEMCFPISWCQMS